MGPDRHRRPLCSAVQGVLEALAGLELDRGRGRYLHRLAGPRVAPLPGFAVRRLEAAEAGDRDLAVALEAVPDRVHHGLDRLGRRAFFPPITSATAAARSPWFMSFLPVGRCPAAVTN